MKMLLLNLKQYYILSSPVLLHNDTNSLLRLAYDASAYGVGAVISHLVADGLEKPIAVVSHTLT